MTKITPQTMSFPTLNRPFPQEINLLREFQKRLPDFMTEKYQELENQIKRIDSGHRGEIKVDGHLTTTLFPEPHFIFPDYHAVLSSKRYVQIDTLIITPNYILHLEIKNIRGKIELLENPSRLKRTSNQQEDYFSCPITQMKRNHYALQLILQKLNFELPPIYPALIFANRNCEVLTSDNRVPIFFPLQLENHILKLNKLPTVLTKSQLTKVKTHLRKAETPFFQSKLIEKYGVGFHQLKSGVLCEKCSGTMNLVNRKWVCSICLVVERNPLPRTIQNLLQLSDEFQKPELLRNWLKIKHQKSIYLAVKSIRVQVDSSGKGVRYKMKV